MAGGGVEASGRQGGFEAEEGDLPKEKILGGTTEKRLRQKGGRVLLELYLVEGRCQAGTTTRLMSANKVTRCQAVTEVIDPPWSWPCPVVGSI